MGRGRGRAAAAHVRLRHGDQRPAPDPPARAAQRTADRAAEGDPRRLPGRLPVGEPRTARRAGHACRAAPSAAAAVPRADGRDVGDRPRHRRHPARPRRRPAVLRRVPVDALRRDGAGEPGHHRAHPVRARQRPDGDADRPRPDPGRHLDRPVRGSTRRGLPGRPGAPRIRPRRAARGRVSAPGCRRSPGGRRSPRSTRTSRWPRSARSSGILGVVAILGLYLVVVERGLRIGAAAADDFRSLLAIGLALVIGVQAFIIAAGNLKVLPLTGVTLPFISYGGSSLLANALVVGLLLALSDKGVEPPPLPRVGSRWRRLGRRERGLMLGRRHDPAAARRTTVHVAIVLSLAFGAARRWRPATGASSRRPTWPARPNDAAVIAAARTVTRGRIKDRDRQGPGRQQEGRERRVVPRLRRSRRSARSSATRRRRTGGPARADLRRRADRPGGRPVLGCLRQVRGRPYDPKDLTLSLSCDLQQAAVAALGKRRGAVVMLDPTTGEVLALASTPTYDASAIVEPGHREGHLRGASRTTPTSRSCRARRSGGTCRARSSRS